MKDKSNKSKNGNKSRESRAGRVSERSPNTDPENGVGTTLQIVRGRIDPPIKGR